MRIGSRLLAALIAAAFLAASCAFSRSDGVRVRIIGVYPVAAPEPCHLVEASIAGTDPADLVDSITQELEGQPRESWQSPYDERELDPEGTTSPERRIVFFFHYLDLRRPLLSDAGDLVLPAPSPIPPRLESIRYEPPD